MAVLLVLAAVGLIIGSVCHGQLQPNGTDSVNQTGMFNNLKPASMISKVYADYNYLACPLSQCVYTVEPSVA